MARVGRTRHRYQVQVGALPRRLRKLFPRIFRTSLRKFVYDVGTPHPSQSSSDKPSVTLYGWRQPQHVTAFHCQFESQSELNWSLLPKHLPDPYHEAFLSLPDSERTLPSLGVLPDNSNDHASEPRCNRASVSFWFQRGVSTGNLPA